MSQVEARFDLDRSRFLQKREQNIRAGQFPVVGSLALKPLEQVPQSINPVIWNQAFYFDLYHQVHNRATTLGFGEDEARDLAEQQTHKAMWFDAVAVLQEKVPNETVLGKPIFDPISQAKLTLTPTENVYFVETDPETDQPILVCPEHRWLRKSITKTLTNWRRKLDINVVNLVEQLVAQDSQEERNDSRTLLWDSLIAEDWEEKVIRDNNGEYGYTYVLRLINHPDTGARLAVVHAIKSDVKATSYKYFLENTQGKFYKATETTYKNKEFEGPFVSSIETLEGGGDKRPLLDRLMSTVVELSLGTSDDEVLRQLAKAKKVKEDTDEIFGLPVNAVISLYDFDLVEKVKAGPARKVADFLLDLMRQGKGVEEIQKLVKPKFLEVAFEFALDIKQKPYATFDRQNGGYAQSGFTGQRVEVIDVGMLERFRAPSGGFCGGWGDGDSLAELMGGSLFNVFTRGGKLLTGLSQELKNPKKEGECSKCGHFNACLSSCEKCGGLVKRYGYQTVLAA